MKPPSSLLSHIPGVAGRGTQEKAGADVLIMVPSVWSHRGLTGSVLGDRWTLPTHTPVTPQHSLLNIDSFSAPGKLGHRVWVPSICYVDVLLSLLALSFCARGLWNLLMTIVTLNSWAASFLSPHRLSSKTHFQG